MTEKFVPRWKRQQSEAEVAAPKPSVREEPVVLEPIRLSSLRGTGGGAAASAAAAATVAGSSNTTTGENKYVPPCLRKDGTATGLKASSPQQQSGGSSAVRKLLSNATAAREAAAVAEKKKQQEEQAEARKQQLLEKQRQQEQEQLMVQHAFRCTNDETMHAFVSRAQEMLKRQTVPAPEEMEACVSLLPEADKGSLAAPLCLIGLIFREGFAAQNTQEVRAKAQPLVPVLKRLLNEAREEISQASILIIQQLVILANGQPPSPRQQNDPVSAYKCPCRFVFLPFNVLLSPYRCRLGPERRQPSANGRGLGFCAWFMLPPRICMHACMHA